MTRLYPNQPGGKSLAELTALDLPDLTAREVASVITDTRARMLELHQHEDGTVRDKSPAEQAEFRRIMELHDAAQVHERVADAMRRPRSLLHSGAALRDETRESGRYGRGPEFMRQGRYDLWCDMHDIHRMSDDDVRDRALSALEERGGDLGLKPDQLDQADRLLRSVLSAENLNCNGSYIARRALITESPAYRSAFREAMVKRYPHFTDQEVEALRALEALDAAEFRAMSEGSTTGGGFGVPVFIDPTVILTSGAGAAPILDVCRTERITTSQWKGVSAASVSWSWDAEGSAVSDDSPTLAQPAVPVYMGRGFLPYSIELGEDYPGFAEQMAAMLSQGALDLLATSTVTGSGSSQPTGVVTKLEATAASKVKVATAGAVVAADIFKVWNAVAERFRSQPSSGWGMSVSMESTIRSFSSANQSSAYFTVNLADEGITYLNGKKVTRSDYFPAITGATATQAFCVVGDWSS